jgi:uncharacterized protein with GYD domain
MPKYLIQGSYTAQGAKGVQKEGGTKRRQVVEALLKEVGGKLDAFYFTFGETDFAIIVELPDTVSSAALSLAVNASGAVAMRTIPLITVEEMDAATKKHLAYRPPGQ